MLKRILLMSLAVFSFASLANATSLARTKEVALPKVEIAKLENLACINSHKLKAEVITGYRYEDREEQRPFDYVYVKCQSHGEFMKSPMNYETECAFEKKQWHCEEPKLITVVKLYGRDVRMHSKSMKLELAYEVLSKVSTYGTFQGETIDEAIGSYCNIMQSEDHETVTLGCAYTIRVSFWCPQPELTKCPRVISITHYPV